MKFLRPALLGAAPALLPGLVPAVRGVLVYDRIAILQGDWWRLWTGHWVHFSASHLAWNLAVLIAAGAWLERLQPGSLLRFVALAAPLLGVAFLAGAPAMKAYGGLSGLATGIVVLLALAQWDRDQSTRAWWGGLLALIALKLGVETVRPAPMFASFAGDIRPSGFAHAAGAALAVAFFLSRRFASGRFAGRRHAPAFGPDEIEPQIPAAAHETPAPFSAASLCRFPRLQPRGAVLAGPGPARAEPCVLAGLAVSRRGPR